MQVSRIAAAPVATTTPSGSIATGAGAARGAATGFDREARLEAIRSDMRNAIAFTARAHHGWGGPDPTPTPPSE